MTAPEPELTQSQEALLYNRAHVDLFHLKRQWPDTKGMLAGKKYQGPEYDEEASGASALGVNRRYINVTFKGDLMELVLTYELLTEEKSCWLGGVTPFRLLVREDDDGREYSGEIVHNQAGSIDFIDPDED